MITKNSLGSQIMSRLVVLLLVGIGASSVEADTANYKQVETYRFIDLRQTSANGPTIRNFYVYSSIGLKQGDSASSLSLIAPTGKKYGFQRSAYSTGWWSGYFGINSDQAKHLSLMPGGRYEIQCNGGVLSGQKVSFDLPANLLNPCLPYLEKNSFTLLSKGKLDSTKDNTLLAARVIKTGSPFVVTPQPAGSLNRLTAHIRDDSATGDEVFIWNDFVEYGASGIASFTIPAGKLKKNKIYALSLQTDNDYPDGTATTSEGQIRSRLDGITYYELVFKTSK